MTPGPLAMSIPSSLPDMLALPQDRLAAMEAGGLAVREATRLLHKAGLNVVGECLRGDKPFYDLEHYPADDVYDRDTCSQYYYHHHRDAPEHGHFHTFLRLGVDSSDDPIVSDEIVHLIAISMDDLGDPIGLFATNQWVTGESIRSATEVLALLDRFSVEHAFPNLAVNQWIGAMLQLFQPQIQTLLHHRDEMLGRWKPSTENLNVLDDRALEVTGEISISIDEQMAAVSKELDRRRC